MIRASGHSRRRAASPVTPVTCESQAASLIGLFDGSAVSWTYVSDATLRRPMPVARVTCQEPRRRASACRGPLTLFL
jgi:hypothetical protein